jgi:hypothetical protein
LEKERPARENGSVSFSSVDLTGQCAKLIAVLAVVFDVILPDCPAMQVSLDAFA